MYVHTQKSLYKNALVGRNSALSNKTNGLRQNPHNPPAPPSLPPSDISRSGRFHCRRTNRRRKKRKKKKLVAGCMYMSITRWMHLASACSRLSCFFCLCSGGGWGGGRRKGEGGAPRLGSARAGADMCLAGMCDGIGGWERAYMCSTSLQLQLE